MLNDDQTPDKSNRRKFLKQAGIIAAGTVLGGSALAACGDTATPVPAVATTSAAAAATTSGAATTTSAGGASSAATTAVSSTKQFSGELQLLQWTSFVPAADAEIKRQAAEWGQKNNVKVTIQIVASNDLQAKTTAAVEAKAGPDIIQMQYNWPWLYESACADLSDVYNQLKSSEGGFYDAMTALSVVNNVPRAIPYAIVPNAWAYRKSWLKEQGADKFPDTWDDFHALGKKLKAAGHPMAQSLGHAYGDATTMWYSFLWSYGGKEVEQDGKTVAINSPETLKAVETAVAIYNDCFDPTVLSWDDGSNNKAFAAEQISATLNGSSIYITAKNQKAPYLSDIAHAVQPQGPAGRALINLTFEHAVMNYSKNQDAAKAFLLWLMQPDQYNKWLTASAGYNVGPLHAYDKAQVFDSDPVLTPFKDSVQFGRNPGWPGPPSAAASQVQVKYLIVDMFAKAVQGTAPKDAIAFTEGELKKLYNK